jgi:predicted enzyme related to lactoylglutathione lyase
LSGCFVETRIKPGAVVFCADHQRLARFYAALTGMEICHADETHTLLTSEVFELVLHALHGEPVPNDPVGVREDTYIKLLFPVSSLAQTREAAAALGGQLRPADAEWQARGFRACDGFDPEGNVIQFRETAR